MKAKCTFVKYISGVTITALLIFTPRICSRLFSRGALCTALVLFILSGVLTISGCDLVTNNKSEPLCNPDVMCTNAVSEKWTFLGLEGESVISIAVDTSNPCTIFAGTGYNFSLGISGKLMKSTNCGESWEIVFEDETSWTGVYFDPHHKNTIYALPHNLIISTDGGHTWEDKSEGIGISSTTRLSHLVFDPHNEGVIYAGTNGNFGGHLYKTIDGARTWKRLDGPGSELIGNGVTNLAIDFNNPEVLYVLTGQAGYLLRSEDGGESWNIFGGEGTSATALAVDPFDSNTLIMGRGSSRQVEEKGIYLSTDYGQSWKKENDMILSHLQNGLIFAKSVNTYFAAITGTGIFCRTNGEWKEYSEGLRDSEGLGTKLPVTLAENPSSGLLYAGLSAFEGEGGGIYVRRITN